MEPNLLQIILLGLVQGAAELLPVSSSAHVIIVEKLMGLDPSSPTMTFLLVMLHTGTMIAVIAYFWRAWQATFFSNSRNLKETIWNVGIATLATVLVGFAMKLLIEKILMKGTPHDEIEDLFGQLPLVGGALLVAGILIITAGLFPNGKKIRPLDRTSSLWIGISQGFCLPFRGLSRSGTTISVGMLQGINKQRLEEFSFALAVVITPPVVAKEFLRLLRSHSEAASPHHLFLLVGPGLFGMFGAFIAGLLALRLLSNWLERGHWSWFGFYCIAASAFVFFLASRGF
jgi:undecaprenyl-diphosphatase